MSASDKNSSAGSIYKVVCKANTHDRREDGEMMESALFVDDDLFVWTLLLELLEEGAYEIDAAVDGLDSLAQSDHQRKTRDVLLLDLAMSHRNGLPFLQKVRQQVPTLLPSIIAISANKDALWKAACMGICAALKKPLDQGKRTDHV